MPLLTSNIVETRASSVTVASTVGAAIVGGLMIWKTMYRRKVSQKASVSHSNVVSLEMTDLDKVFYFNAPAISTVTWFKGDYKNAKRHLEHRIKLLLIKNPWLGGRFGLRYGWNIKLYLSYSNEDCPSIEGNLAFVDANISPLSRDTPIAEIGKCVKNYMIEDGRNEPILRVTVIPCKNNPNDNFAVLVQMSHAIGDGATYYSILHMILSINEDNIIKLNPARNMKSKEQQIAAMGKEEQGCVECFGYMLLLVRGLIANMLSSSPLTFQFGIVDPIKIKETKLAAAKQSGVPFVSSNDVITSWFLQKVHTHFGIMAINWRNRLDGHSEMDAGNYENVLFYRKEDSASPALIRQSLKTFRRVVTKDIQCPGNFQFIFSSGIACVTNWSTFAKKNFIMDCEEDLHVPVSSISYFPTTMPVLLLFRARDDQLGLCYFHTTGVNYLESAPFLMEGVAM